MSFIFLKRALLVVIAMGMLVPMGCNKLLPESPTNPDAQPRNLALSQNGNPHEWVGEAHNLGLGILEGSQSAENPLGAYADVVAFLQDQYNLAETDFLSFEDVEANIWAAVEGGHSYFMVMAASGTGGEEAVLSNLEGVILNSSTQVAFNDGIDALVADLQARTDLSSQQKDELLGAIAVGRHSTEYWANFMGGSGFGTPGLEKKNWPLWADIGGFIAGFGGSLIYNNNNGSSGDVNPFASGAALGGMASDLAKPDPPMKD